MNIIIVGAGQLGSRHLQSCLKLATPANIYVVDPSADSLGIAENRAAEIEESIASKHSVQYLSSLEKVDVEHFDFGIIATNSAVRFKVLDALCRQHSLGCVILEKVLFQSVKEYEQASKLLNDCNIKAYVNCPLRVYPFYQGLKKSILAGDKKIRFSYKAGEWFGLGCNSIHYIDLMSFLTEASVVSVNTDLIDNSVINTKRAGYIEFTGTLSVSFTDGSLLLIESECGSEFGSHVEIERDDKKVVFNGLTGNYELFENGMSVKSDSFSLCYQSDLTHKMIEQIQETGSCGLTSFSESSALHIKFLEALLRKYELVTGTATERLSIT